MYFFYNSSSVTLPRSVFTISFKKERIHSSSLVIYRSGEIYMFVFSCFWKSR